MIKHLTIAAALVLSACNNPYPSIQKEAAAFTGVPTTSGLECDYLPYPACNGWRSGGTVSAYGGSFPADKDLTISCAAWTVKHQHSLRAEGLNSYNDYATKYSRPNDGSCKSTLQTAAADLVKEQPTHQVRSIGPSVPYPSPSFGIPGLK